MGDQTYHVRLEFDDGTKIGGLDLRLRQDTP